MIGISRCHERETSTVVGDDDGSRELKCRAGIFPQPVGPPELFRATPKQMANTLAPRARRASPVAPKGRPAQDHNVSH